MRSRIVAFGPSVDYHHEMQIPRFQIRHLSKTLAAVSEADAFQQFVGQVLQIQYPGVVVFPTAGKDGAIDLSYSAEGRIVGECKVVGKDTSDAVEAPWKEIEDVLQRNIGTGDRPKTGQKQYGPWFRTDPAIERYLYCVSADLRNQEHSDRAKIDLCERIKTFFQSLAESNSHLAHLATIEVEVLDWSDFAELLDQQPHLIYRWFPATRPRGASFPSNKARASQEGRFENGCTRTGFLITAVNSISSNARLRMVH